MEKDQLMIENMVLKDRINTFETVLKVMVAINLITPWVAWWLKN